MSQSSVKREFQMGNFKYFHVNCPFGRLKVGINLRKLAYRAKLIWVLTQTTTEQQQQKIVEWFPFVYILNTHTHTYVCSCEWRYVMAKICGYSTKLQSIKSFHFLSHVNIFEDIHFRYSYSICLSQPLWHFSWHCYFSMCSEHSLATLFFSSIHLNSFDRSPHYS